MMSTTPAVEVVNAFKSYGTGTNVLKDLKMRVECGTLYGLLGGSGSGKTSLLSCIVGMRKLDKGEVKVFGLEPTPGRSIGYMPQDMALYEIFTIAEILSYYGKIYGMGNVEIQKRTEFLCNLLSLPDSSAYIKNLSGGGQRRVSFAVAMIHQPKLLILDEPTASVCPLIRIRIWNYLSDIVERNGTTVVISTHYFEECRQTDRIGIMRNGRLLTENNPYTLMAEHKSNLLEDVVLKLCKHDTFGVPEKNVNLNQEKGNGHLRYETDLGSVIVNYSSYLSPELEDNVVMGLKYKRRKSSARNVDEKLSSLTNSNSIWEERMSKSVAKRAVDEYNKITSVLRRNFLMHFRQPVFVIVQLIIPTLQILIFNFIMGTEPFGLKIGVINNEFPILNGSQTFLDYCSRKDDTNSCFGDGLSCSYFKMFEKSQIDWNPTNSVKDALESVHKGETMGFIVIPKDFSAQTKNKLLLKKYASNQTLAGSTIHIRLDFSNQLNSGYLIREFHDRYLMFLKHIVVQCGEDPRLVTLPLNYNAIYGSVEGGWSEFFQPAFILWIIFLLPTAIGIFYVSDVKAGTMDRTLVAGVKYHHLLISILICEGIMVFLQLSLCFIVLLFGFKFHVVGSLPLCIFLCYLMGLVGVTLGLFIGTVCKHEMEVIMAISAIYMMTVPASGGVWPLACINPWWRVVSYMTPVTVPLESIRSVVNRGWGLDHPLVLDGMLVMLGWIAMCCILSAVFHRLRH